MKYILIILLFTSCDMHEFAKQSVESRKLQNSPIIILDSCQYYEVEAPYSHFTYVHKGNCNNPIHLKQQSI